MNDTAVLNNNNSYNTTQHSSWKNLASVETSKQLTPEKKLAEEIIENEEVSPSLIVQIIDAFSSLTKVP